MPESSRGHDRLWSEGDTLVIDLADDGKVASGVVCALVGNVMACGTAEVKPTGRIEIRLRAVVPGESLRPWEQSPLLWALDPGVDPTRIAIRGEAFEPFEIHVAAGMEA